jgi:AcrR family transcriptional regulator
MNRKEKIAFTALHLFAEKGYENTSTQLIAQSAEVSEALIFKHFGNKESLLHLIVKNGYARIIAQNRGMLTETDPLKLIHKVIDLPNKLVKDEPQFWKLQIRLMEIDAFQVQYENFLHPVNTILIKAFTDLGYEHPEKETELILLIVEGVWKSQVLQSDHKMKKLTDFIKWKYQKQ